MRRRQPALALLVALLIALLAATAAVVGSQLLQPSPVPADRGVFTPTGSLSVATGDAQAVRLQDGRVLVVGGGWTDGDETHIDGTSTVEVYDPGTGTFEEVGTLPFKVAGHRLTLLGDGRVLFTGGSRAPADGGDMEDSASADIWDPASMLFTPTGPLLVARSGHTAVLLHDGRVLVVGGTGPAEIWDQATGAFSQAASPKPNLMLSTATLLGDGRMLLVGPTRVQVWDPATDTFGPTASLLPGRVPMTATTLRDGRVALISRCDTLCVDIWDPATGAITAAGSSAEVHEGPTVTLLLDGRILVAGGGSGMHTDCIRGAACTGPTNSAEIWDPAAGGGFSPTAKLGSPRWMHTATLLQDGRVLVAGGDHDVTGRAVRTHPLIGGPHDPQGLPRGNQRHRADRGGRDHLGDRRGVRTRPIGLTDRRRAVRDRGRRSWADDLALIDREVRARHPDPFVNNPESVWKAKLAKLATTLPTATADEQIVQLASLVGLLDSHSYLSGPLHLYPVQAYHFPEGWFLVVAPDPSLVGTRLVAVGGTPIEEVERALRPLVPADNESGELIGVHDRLPTLEFLQGLGIVDDPSKPGFVFERPGGEPSPSTWHRSRSTATSPRA